MPFDRRAFALEVNMANAEDFTPDRAKPLAVNQGFFGISTLKVLLRREIYRLEAEPQEIVGPNPESIASLQDGGERGAEALPIENYDALNVKQVTSRLGKSSIEEIERVQDYESESKNRRSLMQRFDARVRVRREGVSSSGKRRRTLGRT